MSKQRHNKPALRASWGRTHLQRLPNHHKAAGNTCCTTPQHRVGWKDPNSRSLPAGRQTQLLSNRHSHTRRRLDDHHLCRKRTDRCARALVRPNRLCAEGLHETLAPLEAGPSSSTVWRTLFGSQLGLVLQRIQQLALSTVTQTTAGPQLCNLQAAKSHLGLVLQRIQHLPPLRVLDNGAHRADRGALQW